MAPGLSKVIVYEGYFLNSVLNRIATDNLAKQISMSWDGAVPQRDYRSILQPNGRPRPVVLRGFR